MKHNPRHKLPSVSFFGKIFLVFFLAIIGIGFLRTQPSSAQPVLVQEAVNQIQNTNTVNVAFEENATAGNLLVVVCGSRNTTGFTTPAGYNVAIAQAGTPGQAIYYKIADGSEDAATCTAAGSQRNAIFFLEYSGINSEDTLLATGSSTGTSTSPFSGEVEVSAPSLILAGATINSATTFSAWSNSFDEILEIQNVGQQQSRSTYATAGRTVEDPGTFSTTATTGASGAWRGQIVAFLQEGAEPGALEIDFVDSSGVTVENPIFNLSSLGTAFECQQSTGIIGESNQKLRVSNTTLSPGWSVSIAATEGPTANWESGIDTYSFNDSSGDGCDEGQLTIQPSSANIDPGSCSTNGLNLGADTAFIGGSIDNITLLSANSGADTGCSWEIDDIGMEQNIPAEQPPGEYNLDMTLTLVAD